MKKTIIAAAIAAMACVAYSALDLVNGVKGYAAHNGVTVSSGATNHVVIAKTPMQGIDGVYVIDDGALNRTALNVTLFASNKTTNAWVPVAATSFAETNACVRCVPFTGDFLPSHIRVSIGSIGAATKVSSLILTY